MSSEILTYLRLGFHHIADVKGYDHILFVAALTGSYPPSAWRRLLGLVTAFTLGHSVTLALATLGLVHASAAVVEVLIPVTIVVTSLVTVASLRRPESASWRRRETEPRWRWELYLLTTCFGLIHGLGFSTYLRALLGDEAHIALPLFAFNVGLEIGQLAIVLATLLLGVLAVRALGVARRDWVLFLCGATAGVGATMIIDRVTAT
ncbi:MAG: HupE/UreJ family protein [Gemmatimonadaceae bacterium]